jgi:hypothetical protein
MRAKVGLKAMEKWNERKSQEFKMKYADMEI